jgi:hypothetical protein
MVLGRNWRRSAPVNIARTINGLKAPIFASLRPLDIWFKGSIQVGNWPELARILLSSRAAVRSSHRFLTTPAKLYIADWKSVLAMLKMWPFKCSLGPILGEKRHGKQRPDSSKPAEPLAARLSRGQRRAARWARRAAGRARPAAGRARQVAEQGQGRGARSGPWGVARRASGR